VFSVDDEPTLDREHIAYCRTLDVAFWVEAAKQLDTVFDLAKKELPCDDGAAWFACPPGQAWQADGLRERGERESLAHDPSGLELKGITISRILAEKSRS